MTNQPYLQVDDLTYKIKNKVILNHISFNILANEIVFLLGRNGAGKTTLFSLLTGIFRAQQDSIKLFGLNIDKQSHKIFKNLGIVFQQRTLDLDLSVRQNLLYFAGLHGLSKKQALVEIKKSLKNFELADVLNTKIRTLSGGQIRRVELIRSLLNKPKLLLLDEPTAGLDVESRINLTKCVRDLSKESLATFWTTHLMDEIALNDKVIILDNGVIVAMDYAQKIIADTNSDSLQQAFITLTNKDIYA